MPEPGEYLADVTEGITRVEDLPKAKVIIRSRNYRGCRCPCCGRRAYRLRRAERLLHDLGDLKSGRPHDIHLIYSQHHCSHCDHYFNADTSDLALPGSHYTYRVVAVAVRLVVEDGLPYRAASWHLWRDHRVFVPFATLQNWIEASGEKKRQREWRGITSLGRSMTSLAISPPTNSTTGPSVCCPLSITAGLNGSSMRSSITTLPTRTSGAFSDALRRPLMPTT